jgi:hypothetical protein
MISFGLAMYVAVVPTHAQDLMPQAKALQLIEDAANKLCTSIDTKVTADKLELTGEAKAVVSGVLSKLVNVGVDSAAKYQKSKSNGVLQQDLASAISKNDDCRLTVLEMLKDDLLVPPGRTNERGNIQHLMDFLCNRGVLQNDYSWELPDAVHASVEQIEAELGNRLDQLPADSAARQPVQTMQNASRQLLQNPTVFPNRARGSARPVNGALRDAIHEYRRLFSDNIAQLVQIYALKGNCNLSAGLKPVPSK